MEILVERACGLDVHQATVVACVFAGEAGRKPIKEIRTFGTCLRDLEELRDRLTDREVTHVAMESTGVYWKPVYTVLEGSFDLVVGNAHHIKNVPGRKTDAKDSGCSRSQGTERVRPVDGHRARRGAHEVRLLRPAAQALAADEIRRAFPQRAANTTSQIPSPRRLTSRTCRVSVSRPCSRPRPAC